jgi:hypothetical protein
MTKLTITFESDNEDDGFEGKTIIERHNINDLWALSNAYTDATKAAGWCYVIDVAFEKDDGKMVFGSF